MLPRSFHLDSRNLNSGPHACTGKHFTHGTITTLLLFKYYYFILKMNLLCTFASKHFVLGISASHFFIYLFLFICLVSCCLCVCVSYQRSK